MSAVINSNFTVVDKTIFAVGVVPKPTGNGGFGAPNS